MQRRWSIPPLLTANGFWMEVASSHSSESSSNIRLDKAKSQFNRYRLVLRARQIRKRSKWALRITKPKSNKTKNISQEHDDFFASVSHIVQTQNISSAYTCNIILRTRATIWIISAAALADSPSAVR
ncbi:hypothetical protein L3Y34_005840 [Caenorhabditis briggsae]|uniref:Uncharacterized protein n=1 Tax=Caenorhabditis briggsae TaxID=6238 RepID=A0AAE9CYF3_CAEBR|nr:hypothetical protein L3Y34_005840 [Caenorhabditis briggsae]